MRILADENFPAPSIRALRAVGHDVLAVAEVMPHATDHEILERASSEQRLLITFDRDFGEMAVRGGLRAPAGIILLRFTPKEPGEPATVLTEFLAQTSISVSARLTVLGQNHFRQRYWPDEINDFTPQYIVLQAIAP